MPEDIAQAEGFVQREVGESRRTSRKKKIVVKLDSDGAAIDWESMDESERELLFSMLTNDPAALENFANVLSTQTGPQIADTTVVAFANVLLAIEGVAISQFGPRIIPILANVPLPVAVKACTVSKDELEPVMDTGKRVIAKWTPEAVLKYQDELVFLEGLAKIGATRFNECVKMAMRIEELKRSKQSGQSGPQRVVEVPTPRPADEQHAATSVPSSLVGEEVI